MTGYIAARIAGPLAVVVILTTGWFYVRVKVMEADQAKAEAVAANSRAEMAVANGRLTMRLMDRHARLARERAERIADLERTISRERPPLPPVCVRALDPIRDAVDGVRHLRALRGNASGAASAPVPARP